MRGNAERVANGQEPVVSRWAVARARFGNFMDGSRFPGRGGGAETARVNARMNVLRREDRRAERRPNRV